jgi:hypothetical protein
MEQKKLQSENPKNGLKAIGQFFRHFHIRRNRRKEFDYAFEHGQLFILHSFSNASWSVVDVCDITGIFTAFGFEQLESGDESYLETGYIEQ